MSVENHGFHPGWVRYLQLLGIGFQRVVDPGAEQRGFHGSPPRLLSLHRPLPQSRPLSQDFAFLDNLALRRLDAETHAFLVNIESDIVNTVMGFSCMRFSSRRIIAGLDIVAFGRTLFHDTYTFKQTGRSPQSISESRLMAA